MEANDLVEIESIRQLKARYFRCMDEKRWSEWADVFTEDAVLDNTGDGAGITTGRDAIVAFVRGAIHDALTVHHGHMPEIEITGPGSAKGVWAMEDWIEFPNGMTLLGRGHYHEQYAKGSDGQWRIAHLKLTRLVVKLSKAESEGTAAAGSTS